MASGRPDLRWAAKVGASAGFCLVGAVAGTGLYFGNLAYVSGSSSATLPPPTLQIIDAINQPATGPLPSGFTTTTQRAASNETAGFSIAAPTSWQESTSGYQTYLRDPADPNTNILIDLTPHTYQDMLQEAQYIEAQSAPRFPGYHRVGMASMLVRGASGAWWKFTWNNKGVQQEALDVLFVAHTSAGPQSYALYMTAPVSKFDQMRPIFDKEVETFAYVSGSASGSSSATLPPPTLQIIDAINQPATGPLPSGFTTTTQRAAFQRDRGLQHRRADRLAGVDEAPMQMYLRDPADPNTNILIDLTPHTYQDMLQEAQYIEAQSAPRFAGYHRVGMASMLVRGASGAWWKFTWNNKGVQQEALDVLFVAAHVRGPAAIRPVHDRALELGFDQMRPIFDEEAETFATLPG